MNNLTNYHSHCSFCDGRAPLEDFVREAIRLGFTSYGVSSHAPLPFPTRWTMEKEDVPAYLDDIRRLKRLYAADIELYAGMEIDYLNEESNPSIPYFRELSLDYRIGSVHLLESVEGEIIDIDVNKERFSELLPLHFSNDLKTLVCDYYDKLMQMVGLGGFDIVGHADKMSYNASFCQPDLLEQNWYNHRIHEYFSLIAERGLMVEINTKAYREMGVFFPHIKYFPLLKELHIPVLVNSDSHFPERINEGRADALQALKSAGIDFVMELHQGKWNEVKIEDKCYSQQP